jgi:SAM-dependent methyltransferase
MFRFLDLSILSSPLYPLILSRLQSGETLLDLGCCFGQELRQLVHDGAPAGNLYGCDLRQDFMDIGYELFLDRSTLTCKFVPADVFDDNSLLVTQLAGKINMIYTGSFFHLFDYARQVAAAKRCVQILKPERGSLLLGRQLGSETSGVLERPGYMGDVRRFRHNVQSWKEMWEKVSEETGTRWDVEATLDEEWMTSGSEAAITYVRRELGARRLRFVVRRVE